MRTFTSTFGAAGHAAGGHEPVLELQDLSYAVGDPAQAETEHIVRQSPVSAAVRMVGILAFGQSLLFLLLWFLVCASAGAATSPRSATFNPTLQTSTYEPTKTRDPFSNVPVTALPGMAAKLPAGTPLQFQLNGILYETTNPSAIVNGQLVTLNKTVTMSSGGANILVKATAITRRTVSLEINVKKLDLEMNAEKVTFTP